jgi:hypothetical protein
LETVEELQRFLQEMTAANVRGQLLDRGTAWSLIRQQGDLPTDAPPLGETIETDLAEYGFSVLRAALALRERDGSNETSRTGFQAAGRAFESLVQNGSPIALERGFYRVIAGAAYHLAGYSAIAYSLLSQYGDGANNNAAERALIYLILRDLNGLQRLTRDWLQDETHADEAVAAILQDDESSLEDALSIILNSAVCRALAYFDFALQTGEAALVQSARQLLTHGLRVASDGGVVSLWWVIRLCLGLLDDLWQHSLHQNLPLSPPEGGEADYQTLRQLFLTALYGRKIAEIELWPSQLEAARRSTDIADDLVVALPTSAGKTRAAELAALMTLASGKRVLIVTPLRALSAQTERSFRKTFSPLGFTVSSLYGASGVSADDQDALRSRNIVITTPEKLDFALRSDPKVIADVGLIVLDEAHMIGPTEREIRYETLVQRLLRRNDAGSRRIVCLSAILPDGEQLDDLTAWIRSDAPGASVKSLWRPTRQRFGTLIWQGKVAKLNFDLNDSGPFLSRFIEQIPPKGNQKLPLPRETKDLTVFAAWKFAEQGKRTLIFCTQANWVEGYGSVACDLVQRGYLPSLLNNPGAVVRAVEIGREWLGDGHCAVEALKIGLAIHHGGLPNPFLRELELLLSEGVIMVTVASPTLSQGLNLNAAVMLVPSLYRSGAPISGEEFANVAGRAGRAFVDVEGLVVHVMHKGDQWRLNLWRELVRSAKSRTLKSGLIQIVHEILLRFANQGVFNREDAFEYLANSRDPWKADLTPGYEESEPLSQLVEKLDATVFGLVEALETDSADLPRLLDEALQGSLWARQIAREGENAKDLHKAIIDARARVIWHATTAASRKGHFAMGVGLEAGLALDAMADELGPFIDQADDAAISSAEEKLVDALLVLARRLLAMRPFVPDKKNALPDNWETLLRAWVTGVEVNTIGPDNMGVVEEAFTYRLVWALEALRTRRVTLGWSPDVIPGGGAAALETGVPNLMMAMLIRAGLPSRQAAMVSVRKGNASFLDAASMKAWLETDEIAILTDRDDWPTPATSGLWKRFRDEMLGGGVQKWRMSESYRVLASGQRRPEDGVYRAEIERPGGVVWICTPDYQRIARLRTRIRDEAVSLFCVRFVQGDNRAHIQRFGHGRAEWLADTTDG